MKRLIVWVLLAGWMLCACGCGRRVLRPVQPALPVDFTADVRLTAGDTVYTADWTVRYGESVFVIRAPQALSGFTVRCAVGQAKIEKDGVTAALPVTSPFVILAEAYRTLTAVAPDGALTPHGWLYDLKETHGFTVLQDGESGLPIRVSVPAQQITAVVNAQPETPSRA